METQDEKLKALAGRYAKGQCSPEEIRQIQAWYDSFETSGYSLPDDFIILSSAERATSKAIVHVATQQRKERIRKLLLPVLKAAAVLALIISFGLLFYRNNTRTQAIRQQLVSVAPGMMKKVILPDGSVVFLNGGSEIRYCLPFSKHTRDITLKGEGFFTVVHDQRHPFIVHTRKLSVQVLGTSYNVTAYPDEQRTQVTVATGKVGVKSAGKNSKAVYFLTPGQQLSYNGSNGKFTKSTVVLSDIGDWQQQALNFDFETLENISKKLSRVYGVSFVFKDKTLLSKRFQLKVKKESLANILKLLSISGNGFRYQIMGKKVIVG